MSHIINQDYIGVIQREDDRLVFSEFPTNFNYRVAEKLRDMVENDCYSFMDMQRLFYANFYDFGDVYEYATSESYMRSFVEKITFPVEFKLTDYEVNLDREIHHIRRSHKGKSDADIASIAAKNLKSRLFDRYQCFMYAKAYSETLKAVKLDDSIKMYSTENIGWDNQFHLQLTDDIDIIVHTNFCYGSAAYMDFSMRYKGVLIVPYSDYITYYYARVDSFLRYTRRYVPSRYNWQPLLDYVITLGNRTLEDPTSFINTWLSDEIRKMTEGLEDIVANPQEYLKDLSPSKDGVIRVTRIDGGRGFKYAEIDVEDRELNFVSEKISGALLFLEKLYAASLLQGDIKEYFEKIWKMNESLLPDVNRRLMDYQRYIDELRPIVYTLSKKAERLENVKKKEEAKLEAHLDWYQRQVKYKKKEFRTINDLTSEYRENHPNLALSEQQYNDAYREYAIADGKLKRRIAFAHELEVFISRFNAARNIIENL